MLIINTFESQKNSNIKPKRCFLLIIAFTFEALDLRVWCEKKLSCNFEGKITMSSADTWIPNNESNRSGKKNKKIYGNTSHWNFRFYLYGLPSFLKIYFNLITPTWFKSLYSAFRFWLTWHTWHARFQFNVDVDSLVILPIDCLQSFVGI